MGKGGDVREEQGGGEAREEKGRGSKCGCHKTTTYTKCPYKARKPCALQPYP